MKEAFVLSVVMISVIISGHSMAEDKKEFNASTASAQGQHDKWVIINSMSQPIYKSVQRAQGQIGKLGVTDTSTPAGKKANRLIAKGKQMQTRLLNAKTKPLSKQEANQLLLLVKQMDQAAGPGKGTQGACFSSCDHAYGSGFGGGAGWNRFWCKASCFKINVNVGHKPGKGIGSYSGSKTNTAQPVATLHTR